MKFENHLNSNYRRDNSGATAPRRAICRTALNQGQSNLIKPDQTKSNQKIMPRRENTPERPGEPKAKTVGCTGFHGSRFTVHVSRLIGPCQPRFGG